MSTTVRWLRRLVESTDQRSGEMKYMMLAYTNVTAWEETLTETGEFVATEGLADPSHTKTVRKASDGVVVTDGPYAEVKEVLVSYAILDCASHERAMEIAARVCDAVGDTVEVRPIPEGPAPF
jgi:hypothetical protein